MRRGSLLPPHLQILAEAFEEEARAVERLEGKLEDAAQVLRQVAELQIQYYEAIRQTYESVGKLTEATANYAATLGTTIRSISDLINVTGRAAETFTAFGRTLLNTQDALAAIPSLVGLISTGLTDLGTVAEKLTSSLSSFARIFEEGVRGMESAAGAISRISSLISQMSHIIKNITSELSNLTSAVAQFADAFKSEKIARFAAIATVLIESFKIGFAFLESYIRYLYLRLSVPIQQLSALFAEFSARLQYVFLPLRVVTPIVEGLVNALGALGGTLQRVIQSYYEFLQALAPIQGQVTALNLLLTGLTDRIGDFISSLSQYGTTLAALWDYVRESISAGVVPMSDLVSTLSQISYTLSVISGLSPDEVFRRLSQAVFTGNVSLLNQLNILMTEADLLNIIYQRTGLLLTSLREVHPLLRARLMAGIVREEAARIQVEGPTLLQFLGELRGVFSAFIARLAETLGGVRDLGLTQQLREALRQLFSPQVVENLRIAFSTLFQTIGMTITDVIGALRRFFESPALQNFITILEGIILGIGRGFTEVINMIRSYLEGLDPSRVMAIAARIGASISAFIQTAALFLQQILPSLFTSLGRLILWMTQNAQQMFQLFRLAALALIQAAQIMMGVAQQAPSSLMWGGIGSLFGGAGGGLLGYLIAGALGAANPVVWLIAGIATLLGTILGGYLGFRGAGGLGVPPQAQQQLSDIVGEAQRTLARMRGRGVSIEDIGRDLERTFSEVPQRLMETYRKIREREEREIMEQLGQVRREAEPLADAFNRVVQAVEPVIEQLRNFAQIARDSATLLGTFGETYTARIGPITYTFTSAVNRLATGMVVSADYVEAAAARYAIAMFATATGARGLSESLYQAFQRLLSSIREFHDSFSNLIRTLREMVGILPSLFLERLRTLFALGQFAPPTRAVGAMMVGGPAVVEFGARLVGQMIQGLLMYQREAERLGLVGTVEYQRRVAEGWTQIRAAASEALRVYLELGQILTAHAEALLNMSSIWTGIAGLTRNYGGILEGLVGIIVGMMENFDALATRIAHAFGTGNIEEWVRLVNQLWNELYSMFFERLPRAVQQIVSVLRRPFDMWMENLNELRGVLQSLGAEGMVFPIAFRSALPILTEMMTVLIQMRDTAFRQGLIPAAMEFNRELLRVQRTIMEILGLGGMFLPAYTPEQIIRLRERMGVLPQQLLVEMMRGRIPMEAPGIRVVPPALLWQLLAFAPGALGLFGPFMAPGQLFGLIPAGIFRGFWAGLGFLGGITPQNIQQAFLTFLRGMFGFTTGRTTGLLGRFLQGVWEGMFTPIKIEGPENIMGYNVQNIEIGRVLTARILIEQARIEMAEGRQPTALLGAAAAVMTAPIRYPTLGIIPGAGYQQVIRGFQEGTRGFPILVGETGPEIVSIEGYGRMVVGSPTVFVVPPDREVSVTPTYSTYGLENYIIGLQRGGEVRTVFLSPWRFSELEESRRRLTPYTFYSTLYREYGTLLIARQPRPYRIELPPRIPYIYGISPRMSPERAGERLRQMGEEFWSDVNRLVSLYLQVGDIRRAERIYSRALEISSAFTTQISQAFERQGIVGEPLLLAVGGWSPRGRLSQQIRQMIEGEKRRRESMWGMGILAQAAWAAQFRPRPQEFRAAQAPLPPPPIPITPPAPPTPMRLSPPTPPIVPTVPRPIPTGPFEFMTGIPYYYPPMTYVPMGGFYPSGGIGYSAGGGAMRYGGGETVSSPVRVPVIFDVTLNIMGPTGTVLGIVTKEIQTIIDITPKVIRTLP